MAHHNTVFVQLLRFLPRHEFEAEARQHQRGQGLRVMSRWAQFVALGLAQLTGRQSLRDIVSNLSTQGRKLYHLGVGTTVSRSSLARVNAERQCRAAVHSLRDAVRTPAEPLSAVRAEARLSVQEQVVRGRCDDHRFVFGGLPVGVFSTHEGRDQAAHRAGSGGPSAELRQCDRGQDRRRQGRPHLDVSSRQRGRGGPRVS